MSQDTIIGIIITIIQVFIPCVGVSIAYFIAGKNKSIFTRLIKSSHGIIFVIAYGYAMVAQNFTVMGNTGGWLPPFHTLMIIGFVSILLSGAEYVKPAWHLLQLILIPSALLIWLAGYLTIIHDSI
jgi:ethanolamine utilization microcompartment shell protein EutS